jgi:hypothetical protein
MLEFLIDKIFVVFESVLTRLLTEMSFSDLLPAKFLITLYNLISLAMLDSILSLA